MEGINARITTSGHFEHFSPQHIGDFIEIQCHGSDLSVNGYILNQNVPIF
jgi:hypothetical protein